MTVQQHIKEFLAHDKFAVVGASNDRAKYGNKVLRAYLQQGKTAYPVNPNAEEVEGIPCVPTLSDLTEPVRAISIITPPEVTQGVIDEAIQLDIDHIWIQPGAEDRPAIKRATDARISVIAWGPCLLVSIGYRE